ncbi:MAG: GNAT family N-acetyltransferase [Phycisphaeraceae bacterium]|nr:GNAT family N-acetyltransferase [Phycisphaeraceae bacterium]MBX3406814.1 GNAT family N-acetyltransferase [Phycisphaeraceae bacterium]
MEAATIRHLTADDAPAYAVLRREMLRDSPLAFAASESTDVAIDPAKVAQRLAEPGVVIVGAFGGGALVGVASLMRQPHPKMAHRAYVYGVYVTPSWRGRGVGEGVMRAAIDAARAWPDVDSIGLSVSAATVHARRLYERLGFAAWGVEPGALRWEGRAYDEVHMCLQFRPPS